MGVPGYQDFMLPLLRLASDGADHTVSEAVEQLARSLDISGEAQAELLPSGTQTRLYNRVGWARTYLIKSGILASAGRGRFRISDRGRQVLQQPPSRIDNAFLNQFEEYRAFKLKRAVSDDHAEPQVIDDAEDPQSTPDERLDAAYAELRETLADDLLQRVRSGSPRFFERLVVQLLTAMGYGGSAMGSARVVGRSGDGGIDGVIQEDQLGLDMIYVQAKKWENAVGPDQIRAFVGSLGEQRAHKGVFITSGSFTSGARTAAERANAKVVLIDGDQLAELMIDYGVGVTDYKKYVIKKLDGDFFDET